MLHEFTRLTERQSVKIRLTRNELIVASNLVYLISDEHMAEIKKGMDVKRFLSNTPQ